MTYFGDTIDTCYFAFPKSVYLLNHLQRLRNVCWMFPCCKVMMEHLEDIFFEHGVNLVLAGHVHSFERTWPAYRNETNACGPSYINIGDGGNREGPYAHWLPFENPHKAWSAFRQGAFGIGDLKIMNETHAFFTWRRNACFDNGEANFDATNCSSTGG